MFERIIRLFAAVLLAGLVFGCDATDEFIERGTGKKSVEEFKKTMETLDGVDKQQKERYRDLHEDMDSGNR